MSLKRKEIIDSTLNKYPGLVELLLMDLNDRISYRYPETMAVKPKAVGMLKAILTASVTLSTAGLDMIAVEQFNACEDSYINKLYYGFVLRRDHERGDLIDPNAQVYIDIGNGRLPLESAIHLYLLVVALSDNARLICNRYTLGATKRWITEFRITLANDLRFVMNIKPK